MIFFRAIALLGAASSALLLATLLSGGTLLSRGVQELLAGQVIAWALTTFFLSFGGRK